MLITSSVLKQFSLNFVKQPCQAYFITIQNFRPFGSIGSEILVVSCMAHIKNHPVYVLKIIYPSLEIFTTNRKKIGAVWSYSVCNSNPNFAFMWTEKDQKIETKRSIFSVFLSRVNPIKYFIFLKGADQPFIVRCFVTRS